MRNSQIDQDDGLFDAENTLPAGIYGKEPMVESAVTTVLNGSDEEIVSAGYLRIQVVEGGTTLEVVSRAVLETLADYFKECVIRREPFEGGVFGEDGSGSAHRYLASVDLPMMASGFSSLLTKSSSEHLVMVYFAQSPSNAILRRDTLFMSQHKHRARNRILHFTPR